MTTMYTDFSHLFHRSSKDLTGGGTVRIPHDTSRWPKEWTTTFYKSYGNVEQIPLERPHKDGSDFFRLIEMRHSTRRFSAEPVDGTQLSALLYYACGIVRTKGGEEHRAYPSGGARFPIEIYPLVFRGSAEIPAGVYHYDVRNHGLDSLWKRSFSVDDIGSLFTYDWVKDASFAIIMTAVFDRSQMKYGERGYRYMLLEAGHIGENFYLASEALGLGCCGLGGSRDETIEQLLEIDGVNESLVHTMVFG